MEKITRYRINIHIFNTVVEGGKYEKTKQFNSTIY